MSCTPTAAEFRRFRAAYSQHRASEGRGAPGAEHPLDLPYAKTGPFTREWRIRARTFDAFRRTVLDTRLNQAGDSPRVLDVGAGNGWLCYRVQRAGCSPVALDMRTDSVDGLGAAAVYRAHGRTVFGRIAAAFDDLPLATQSFDVVLFNASLHYALDLRHTLSEAARVARPGGCIAVLDSPFYRSSEDGMQMVAEKHREATKRFGSLKDDLLALPFIEFLTPELLHVASEPLGLHWIRHRVRYPLAYELRPLVARLRGRRPPSRFDLWLADVPGPRDG